MSDTLKGKIVRLAHAHPEHRAELLGLLRSRRASTNPNDWPALFDSLRKGQLIQVAMTSVMGMSPLFDGNLHTWEVGRKSISKKWGVTTYMLNQPGERPPDRRVAVTLRKRGDRVSAAWGDMAVMLKELRT